MKLNRPQSSFTLQLLEIPTSASELFRKQEIDKTAPTIGELQASFSKAAESSIGDLHLPAPAELVDYQLETNKNEPLQVKLVYLSDRDIGAEAQDLIVNEVRTRLNYPDAEVSMTRIESTFGPLTFGRNQSSLTTTNLATVDQAGQTLQQHPTWHIEIATSADQKERDDIPDERGKAISTYLTSKWQLAADRITIVPLAGLERRATFKIKMEQK